MLAINKGTRHHHVCSKGMLCGSFSLHMGGLRTPQPPHVFKLAIKKTHHVVIIFAVEKVAQIILFANGPQPRAVLNPSMLAKKGRASCHHHVFGKGKLCGSSCLQVASHPVPIHTFSNSKRIRGS